jgi:hypothetical protein
MAFRPMLSLKPRREILAFLICAIQQFHVSRGDATQTPNDAVGGSLWNIPASTR